MTWVEQIARRTRKLKVYQDDAEPRRRRVVATIADQHYYDGSAWQEVDDALVDDGADGFAHRCDRTRHIIRLGATGTRRWYPRRDHPQEYVEFGRLQAWSGSAWANVNLGTPTRSGNAITWDTINFRLTLTNTWHRVKIEVVLKTETARRRLRWAVSLNGLTWDAWQLRGADDVIVGTIDRPTAWDATGSEDAPNVTITTSYSSGYVEFGSNLAGATLPITIDPTFTDGNGGDIETSQDTNIYYNSGNNFGTTNNFWIGYRDGVNVYRALLKFLFTGLASDVTVNSATLSLYEYAEAATNARTLRAYRQKRAWVEGTRDNGYDDPATGATWTRYDTTHNWATAGGFGEDDCEQTDIGSRAFSATEAAGWKDFSLTASEVQEWIAGTFANNGLLLKADTESSDGHRFYSSDYATDATLRPKLVVDYTAAAAGNPHYAYAQQ